MAVQASGDPLGVLEVVASSLQSIQEVFDKHPQLETIECNFKSESNESTKNDAKEPNTLNQIQDLCAKYSKGTFHH